MLGASLAIAQDLRQKRGGSMAISGRTGLIQLETGTIVPATQSLANNSMVKEVHDVIDIGSAFPAFELPADNGKLLCTADLAGKPCVVFFYPKDDTTSCTRENQEFSALLGQFKKAGVRLIGVSPDTVKSHCAFRDKFTLKVPLLADPDRVLIDALGLWVEKQMYGRAYLGLERTTYLVDGNGQVVNVWRKVKTPGHAAEVLAAAKSLAANHPSSTDVA
jgi:thioredoxin-dependent peroxiredoxin